MENEVQVSQCNAPATMQAPIHERVLELAISQGAPLEKLEKFLDIKREYEANEAKKEFASAMARVHANMPTIAKKLYNSQTRSKYADLGLIIETAKPAYSAEGFFVTFYEGDCPKEDHIRVFADVSHSGGHTKTYYYDAPMEGKGLKGNANMTATHAKASSISYARRYLMCMVLNLPTMDDDGNSATPKKEEQKSITTDQAVQITDLLNEVYGAGTKFVSDWLNWMKVEAVEDIQAEKYQVAISALNAAKAKKEAAKK